MSAGARRRALAAIGCDLVARDGGPGERRGQALLRSLSGAEDGALDLDDLAAVPKWLRLPRSAQRHVARCAALLSMAPTLAATIDGARLRDHAKLAGDETLDWAIGQAATVPAGGLPPVSAEALDARGLALMRAALPATLHALVEPGAEAIQPSPAMAQACLASALRGAAAA